MPVSTVMALQIEDQPHGAQNLLPPYPSVGCPSAVASLPTSARTNTCIYSRPTYDIALPDASGFLDHNLPVREISTVTKYETVVASTGGSPTQQTLAATESSSPGVDSYLGPLLGGLLGGFFGLILLVIALWYIW